MAGFTKLFSSILTSSVWQEDDKTRLLWITMLASADADGRVEAAIPGMAMLARISIAECEHGLEVLLSPDEYSRTTEHEGRRIEAIDGGWLILNYRKYRDSARPASRAEYHRKRRARIKRNGCATVAQQEAENAQHPGVARNTRATSRIKRIAGAEAEAEADKETTKRGGGVSDADRTEHQRRVSVVLDSWKRLCEAHGKKRIAGEMDASVLLQAWPEFSPVRFEKVITHHWSPRGGMKVRSDCLTLKSIASNWPEIEARYEEDAEIKAEADKGTRL